MPTLTFPGTTIQAGSSNQQAVTAIQNRLVAVGCGPLQIDGQFGAETFAAVEHFQARSVDNNGMPLVIDGKVGPTTWSVLFGNATVPPVTSTTSPMLTQVLVVAAGEIGIMEVPLGSNRGPKVDIYVSTTGLDPASGPAWCACFVYWCFFTACNSLSIPNPCVRTAGVLDHWALANSVPSARRILPAEAQAQPSLIVPGTLFLLRTSSTTGHMGFIQAVQGNQLTTVEGNTNTNGSREGTGVFQHTTRTIGQINLGFVLYS
jgi:CHAP domain/Putative peptidoglycan binding domain